MHTLSLKAVGTLEQYKEQRSVIRTAIIEHKRNRRIPLGPNSTLHFEDFMTMKYQVQEMMRAEQLVDAASIEEEIAAYQPMIPDGSNLKACFMIEFPDEIERKRALSQLIGIEERVWVKIAEFNPVYAIADEDLPRSTQTKTSAVHFLRFEFTQPMIEAAKSGQDWHIGCDHPNYPHQLSPLPRPMANALAKDFA